jgi:hypothetical protein
MRHFVLLISLLAIVAVIAGCGGSSDSSDTASGTSNAASDGSSGSTTSPADDGGSDGDGTSLVAKSEFITEADAICKRIQQKTAPLGDQYAQLGESARTPQDLEKLAGVVRELLDYADKGITGVQGLEEPAADQQVIEDYVATIKERIATGEEFADALEAGNQSEASSLSEEAGDISQEAERKAKSYGFAVCGIAK